MACGGVNRLPGAGGRLARHSGSCCPGPGGRRPVAVFADAAPVASRAGVALVPAGDHQLRRAAVRALSTALDSYSY
jgi:hypothetical protein